MVLLMKRLLPLLFLITLQGHAQLPMTLATQEALLPDVRGIDRVSEPVSVGLPLPDSAGITGANQFGCTGSKVCQFRWLASWPDGHWKWVQFDYQDSMRAGKLDTSISLTSSAGNRGANLAIDADPENPNTGTISVDTGAEGCRFIVQKANFDVLHSVVCRGRAIVAGGGAGLELMGPAFDATPTATCVFNSTCSTSYRSTNDKKSQCLVEENGLPVFAKQYRGTVSHSIHRLSVVTAGIASTVGLRFPVVQYANLGKQNISIVWKSTDSLDRLGVILRALEDCRAVRILRHPCGYISSVLRGEAQAKFVSAVRTSEDYGIIQSLLRTTAYRRGLTIDHMREFHPVERMAWIWVLMNEKAAEDTAFDERCTCVRYEDVCQDPMNKVKELFRFCGLLWNSQTQNFIEASTLTSQTRGLHGIKLEEQRYYSVFKDPLRSANKWKSTLKPEDIQRVYRVLAQSDLSRLYPDLEEAPRIPPSA
jgi:hypothetical protein